jgi:hypothetical protein
MDARVPICFERGETWRAESTSAMATGVTDWLWSVEELTEGSADRNVEVMKFREVAFQTIFRRPPATGKESPLFSLLAQHLGSR